MSPLYILIVLGKGVGRKKDRIHIRVIGTFQSNNTQYISISISVASCASFCRGDRGRIEVPRDRTHLPD